MKTCKVIFAPSSKEVIVNEGSSILDAARTANVYIDSHCSGKGTCGKCKVRVIEGNVNPVTLNEIKFINESDRELGFRLACMTMVDSDLTVFLPGENIIKAKTADKLFSKRTDVNNPAVKSYYVELVSGKDDHSRSYLDEMKKYLYERYGLKDLDCDINALQSLVHTMKEGKGNATVFIWMDKEIISLRPGQDEKSLGLALDIGTTTVALYLCDLQNGEVISSGSVTNPQVLFGTDIMSRINFSVDHPAVGIKKMQTELIRSVNAIVNRMTEDNGVSNQQILDMTVVGNTVMHHIFLGIAPDHLGLWPFSPSVQESVNVKAREFGIRINPAAYVHVLPVEAGFVGADNVGVLLSETPYNQEEMSLTIDLGTNGEIVLGNKDTLLSCSCATGPALEGAHIVSGMRASAGAIEKVSIDPETFEVDYKVIGADDPNIENGDVIKPIGICGSGIIDTVAHFFKTGLIGESGAFNQNIKTPRLRKGHSGVMEFVLAWKDETATGNDIVLSQKDVRQIQLAKGALHGGCRILMSRLNITSIKKMVIAGAFGMHIDKENALTIGLFPWCEPENIIMAGNSAGHGAYLALVNIEKRNEADRIAKDVIHIELALEKEFQTQFMKALSIPYEP
ncbi:MAG: DUF4445 domain-containing protein [Spirochaetes bacterium]|nr:DUF4445 domain-containing protein [Spirochaetota bacterium]